MFSAWRVLLFVSGLAILFAPLAPVSAPPPEPVVIQFLAVSDWHGQLDPRSVAGIGTIGGAAALSSYWTADRAANPNTLTLTTGDAFGATPPLSGLFDDEPTVLAMNLMGFDADTLGNHNFDRGIPPLQELVDLADFPFVSANLRHVEDNLAAVSPFHMFTLGGFEVAVIGITNPDASTLFPADLGTIEVTDPVPAANKARAAALRDGAKVIVVIAHLGVQGTDPATGAPVGPLIDFANDVGGFDLIVGGHTDAQFAGVINNALVVQSRERGVTYSRITLRVHPVSGHVIERDVDFVTPLTSGVTPDPDITSLLAPYRVALAEKFDEVIGLASDAFPRGNIERLQEVAIGNLVADAMRERYGTQLALINGGGLRAPLPSAYLPADHSLRRTSAGYAAGPPFDLVVGDGYAVLPFGEWVVTRTVTGSQLYAALENSVSAIPAASGRFGQISGFKFTYDAAMPVGSRVVSVTLMDGSPTPIFPDGTVYTLAVIEFVAEGGDGYTMLADGQGVHREVMADVLISHILSLGVITPTIEGRIIRLS